MFHDPYAIREFLKFWERNKPTVCIETGTDEGHGALLLGVMTDTPIFSVDNDPLKTDKNERLLKGYANVFCSESTVYLRRELQDHKFVRVLLYLDAHGPVHGPILQELEVIAEAKLKYCCIIIHDFKVPDRPNFGYMPGLDIETIGPYLLRINPEFTWRYNREACQGIHRRGILYVEPPEELALQDGPVSHIRDAVKGETKVRPEFTVEDES